MTFILSIGLLSGALQFLGYIFYIKKTGKDEISPNPTTWLIFAFDTTLLTILEGVAGAKISILFLPIMCSAGALYVAWLIRRSGKLTWPTDSVDAYILKIGIFIGLAYSIIFTLWHFSFVPASFLYFTGFIFLILSNINTFVAFIPIIREVHKDPLHEHAGPWTIWTIAYLLLGIVTFMEVGTEISGLIFYMYPLSCLVLHGLIAYLSRDKRKIKFKTI